MLKGGAASAEGHYAALDPYTSTQQLVVSDLRSGGVTHSWPLPAVDIICPSDIWRWSGKLLLLPFVTASHTDNELEEDVGLLLVATGTGLCTSVLLATVPCSAGEQLSAYVSAWSCAGLVLVSLAGPNGVGTVSVVNAQGQIVGSTPAPQSRCLIERSCWSPDSRSAVLFDGADIWIWDLQSNSMQHSRLLDGFNAGRTTWARDSQKLLIEADGGSSMLVWASQQDQQLLQLQGASCAGWGRHHTLALLQDCTADAAEHMGDHLVLLLRQLVLGRILLPLEMAETCMYHVDAAATAALSPDGALLCLPALSDAAFTVHVLDIEKGLLLGRFPVPFAPVSITWSSDDACLLLCDKAKGCFLLLDFG